MYKYLCRLCSCLLIQYFLAIHCLANDAASINVNSAIQDISIDEIGLDLEFDLSVDQSASEKKSVIQEYLIEPTRFTFAHEIAKQLNNPYRMTNNRSSFRIEYEKYLFNSIYLKLDGKVTAFTGSDHRAEAEKKGVEIENSSRESFLQFSFGDTSIRLGKQILIWGESDGGSITDVISPRNFSELFFISLEESRVGQNMFVVDQFTQLGEFSFFYVDNPRFNITPKPGTAYFFDPFSGQSRITIEDNKNSEYGFRWKRTFGRSDFSLMAAKLVDNNPLFRFEGTNLSGQPLFKKLSHQYEMLGAGFNYASKNSIISGEFAYKSPLVFTDTAFNYIERNQFDSSLKGEYSLGKSGAHTVSLELVNKHIISFNENITSAPKDSNSLVLGWNNNYLNETFTVNALVSYEEPYSSWLYSIFSSYSWNDNVTLDINLFYLDVQDERNSLFLYRNQDHLQLTLKYQI